MKWWGLCLVLVIGCATSTRLPESPSVASAPETSRVALIDEVIGEFEQGYQALRGEERLVVDMIREKIADGDLDQLRGLLQEGTIQFIENEQQQAFWALMLNSAYIYRKHRRCVERYAVMMVAIRTTQSSGEYLPEVIDRFLIQKFGTSLYECR